jgi:hypothetical protein
MHNRELFSVYACVVEAFPSLEIRRVAAEKRRLFAVRVVDALVVASVAVVPVGAECSTADSETRTAEAIVSTVRVGMTVAASAVVVLDAVGCTAHARTAAGASVIDKARIVRTLGHRTGSRAKPGIHAAAVFA